MNRSLIRMCFAAIMAVAFFGASESFALYHWAHKLAATCDLDVLYLCSPVGAPYPSHAHIDTNSSVAYTKDLEDSNAKLTDQIKVGWTNGTDCDVTKNEGTVTVNGSVSVSRTLSWTVGSSTSQSITCAAGAKGKTEGSIGYSSSQTVSSSGGDSQAITIGAGVTDTNPTVTVPPGKSIRWRIDVYGKKAKWSAEIRKQHYCVPTSITYITNCLPGGPVATVTMGTTYSNDGDLVGSGDCSGENPDSVHIVYLGVS